jgi:DNA adenine methylase
MAELKSPFPWFGGKSKIASTVWQYLGDVDHYAEPFAGSLATLLLRPHTPRTETVNDIDAYVANFWRALQHDPEKVARYANNPVNEADLTAQHIWLVNSGADRIARILGDPEFYDAKVAGWWVWGICCWIGGKWCKGDGPWGSEGGRIAHIRDSGRGVNRQRVHLGNGRGVNRKLVHLGNGRGVNRKRVHLGSCGQGVNTGEKEILSYLDDLAQRLRYVRVCCGDWARIVTKGALSHGAVVGVFLDPPYNTGIRTNDLYNTDDRHGHVSHDVFEWCIKNQDNPRYRIVLAGYEGEHDMPESWLKLSWVAGKSYGTSNARTANDTNRTMERIWVSPHCLRDTGYSQMKFA